MAVQLSLRFSPDILYPKELAETNPDFPWNNYKCDPYYGQDGKIMLVNADSDSRFIDWLNTAFAEFPYDAVNQWIDVIENHLVWTDDGYVGTITLDDEFANKLVTYSQTHPEEGTITVL